ncbi:response regulator [Sulfurimonas sp. SAG-AH-194-C20]|nr:response regulator [Sulfurimonas sp. SAG-AH-194-C20]
MNKKIKLLYAEDEYTTRQDHISYIKSRYDFDIFVAGDGEKALELYSKHKPEIVMTDITMPKMTGLELIVEIRKISKHTKIIILTAHSEQEKLLQALDSQVINYLVKPINRQKLKKSLDTALELLAPEVEIVETVLVLSENASYDMKTQVYSYNLESVKLTNYENKLLKYLCERKNMKANCYDIFVYLWDDLEKEYSADSIRTLVKNLRKKLPDNILENIYGGFYRLNI